MSDTPQTRAVALSYDGSGAPRVTAKGDAHLAERILEVAAEHGIPLHHDPALAQLLSQVDLGDQIPRSLYVAVAEVIAFAYAVTGRLPDPE